MVRYGPVERKVYDLRREGPLIIPQLDPDKHDTQAALKWFNEVKENNIFHIAMGGSFIDPIHLQELLNIAIKDFDFSISLYITSNAVSLIKGIKGRTSVYWMQVLHTDNSFYSWDGLIANSLNLEKNHLEPLPTLYVFDDRGSVGTANWITRASAIPRNKPEISLAVAKAADYFGVRFYIMAGGSGAKTTPPVDHVRILTKNSSLFVIPTSGINYTRNAEEMFSAGADAIHLGNLLENTSGLKILKKIIKVAKNYPGKEFP